MRFSSEIHSPRSISLQRSEQKGRHGLDSAQMLGLPQIGQGTVVGLSVDDIGQYGPGLLRVVVRQGEGIAKNLA